VIVVIYGTNNSQIQADIMVTDYVIIFII